MTFIIFMPYKFNYNIYSWIQKYNVFVPRTPSMHLFHKQQIDRNPVKKETREATRLIELDCTSDAKDE